MNRPQTVDSDSLKNDGFWHFLGKRSAALVVQSFKESMSIESLACAQNFDLLS